MKEKTFIKKINFKNLYHIYMKDIKNRLKPTTIFSKQNIFLKHILPYFEDKCINDISPNDIRQWQNTIISNTCYSKTYLKNINNQMSCIMNYACRFYNLSENPCLKAGSIGQCHADEMKYWTLDEYLHFRKALNNRPEAYICFEILYWTGMREGELLALTPSDIDMFSKIIRINKNYKRLHKQDIISSPKTRGSKREVPIPDFLARELSSFLKKYNKISPSERIFNHTSAFLYHEMDLACKKSNVKRIRIHDIRHSHASLLINNRCEPLLLSKRLGHSNVSTTLNTYSHLFPHKQEEIIRSLENMLASTTSSSSFNDD